MDTSNGHIDIDAYIDGELDEEEVAAVEEHIENCVECHGDVDALRQAQEVLRSLPPEALLDGPPDDADLLLQRTLRQARAESATSRPRRISLIAAGVAAAAAVVALAAGVVVGRVSAPEPTVVALAPPPTVDAPVPADVRFASALDPQTGARLTVRVVPAAGWIRVNAAVTGIQTGEPCRLVVLGRDGRREIAGGWLVGEESAAGGVNLDGSALISADDVAAIAVENTNGRRFVEVTI